MTSSSFVTSSELHARLTGCGEFALLDVRDTTDLVDEGALLLAIHVPLSELPRQAPLLVPRRGTPVAVLDRDGGALAERGRRILVRLGYGDVRVVQGGVRAWQAAGHATYASSYIFGLAFATFLERVRPTPHVNAPELDAWLKRADAPLVLDTRAPSEAAVRSLPGAVQATGADTVRLALAHVADPQRAIVVHCAGYTRSITAAQGLRDAGLPNPVHLLRDGTKAWQLAGLPFVQGGHEPLPAAHPRLPQADAQEAAAARALRARFGVEAVDTEALARLDAEAPQRSTFFLDIRSAEEAAIAPLAGFRSVPHEGIWPWTPRHVGVLRARIVLGDSAPGLRAASIAAWLRRQGWDEVFVHLRGPAPAASVRAAPAEAAYTPGTTVVVRNEDLRSDDVLADVSPSAQYARGHVPGARLVTQARLPELAAAFPGRRLVLTAPTQRQAEEAVLDFGATAGAPPLAVLAGGNAGWAAAGRLQERGTLGAFGPVRDAVAEKWDAPDWRERFLALMAWEHTLPQQIAADDTLPFRDFP
ncbi:rhodanese-like domain-containing protein [Xylophilus sp.]|uniref:rhodanese-like domain-containing protein n=1 Tax=Xylophilus sp. TaxID=2653893 RepID=UPI0013BD0D8A|nr:rhodanese-like domain-containing protein [Xylophilus sp.]KAF1050026.1 MAG: Thiosulfate sulfurtransferase GlpE [Xylophilus sp.]